MGEHRKPLSEHQQEAVLGLYRILEQIDRADEREAHNVWRKLNGSTHAPVQRLILHELHTALVNLRGNQIPDLQAILGSWGDTMDDDDIYDFLRSLNTHGQIIIPEIRNTLASAIARRAVVTLLYGGKHVKVEPHVLGLSFSGREVLRAYRVGKARPGELFELPRMSGVEIGPETFSPRPDYRGGDHDSVMFRVLAAVKA
jgi:hypothetical protein